VLSFLVGHSRKSLQDVLEIGAGFDALQSRETARLMAKQHFAASDGKVTNSILVRFGN
jgi:hypothetical protein